MSVPAPGSRPRSRKCTPSTATANNHEAPRLRYLIGPPSGWVQQVRWSRKQNAAAREGKGSAQGKVHAPSRPARKMHRAVTTRDCRRPCGCGRVAPRCAVRSAAAPIAGYAPIRGWRTRPKHPAFTLPISRQQGCVPGQPRAAQRLGGIHTAACCPPAPGASGVRAEVLQPPQSLQAPHEGALPQPGRRAPRRRRSAAGIQYQAA